MYLVRSLKFQTHSSCLIIMAFVSQGGEEQGVSKDNLAQKRKKEGKSSFSVLYICYDDDL